MNIKLLTEQHLEFLSLKEVAQACLSLLLSKCHIVHGSNVLKMKMKSMNGQISQCRLISVFFCSQCILSNKFIIVKYRCLGMHFW